MLLQVGNFLKGRLASAIAAGDTSIPLSSAIFPALVVDHFFYAVLQSVNDRSKREIVKVTAVSGSTITVIRGQEGTTAQAFSANDLCEQRLTAGQFQYLVDHTHDAYIHAPAAVASDAGKALVAGAAGFPQWGIPNKASAADYATAAANLSGNIITTYGRDLLFYGKRAMVGYSPSDGGHLIINFGGDFAYTVFYHDVVFEGNGRSNQLVWNYGAAQAGSWSSRFVSSDHVHAALLGVAGGKGVVGAHSDALNAWEPLYVNTIDGVSGDKVFFVGASLGNYRGAGIMDMAGLRVGTGPVSAVPNPPFSTSLLDSFIEVSSNVNGKSTGVVFHGHGIYTGALFVAGSDKNLYYANDQLFAGAWGKIWHSQNFNPDDKQPATRGASTGNNNQWYILGSFTPSDGGTLGMLHITGSIGSWTAPRHVFDFSIKNRDGLSVTGFSSGPVPIYVAESGGYHYVYALLNIYNVASIDVKAYGAGVTGYRLGDNPATTPSNVVWDGTTYAPQAVTAINKVAWFAPSSSGGSGLLIGGDAPRGEGQSAIYASVNLHLDASTGQGIYLNYNNTTGFINMMNGKASIDNAGNASFAGYVDAPYLRATHASAPYLAFQRPGLSFMQMTHDGTWLTMSGQGPNLRAANLQATNQMSVDGGFIRDNWNNSYNGNRYTTSAYDVYAPSLPNSDIFLPIASAYVNTANSGYAMRVKFGVRSTGAGGWNEKRAAILVQSAEADSHPSYAHEFYSDGSFVTGRVYVNEAQPPAGHSAARKDYAESLMWVNWATPDCTGSDANNVPYRDWRGDRITNAPSSNTWYFMRNQQHDGNYYHQEAFDYFTDNEWFRRKESGTWTPWRRRLHSGNAFVESMRNNNGAGKTYSIALDNGLYSVLAYCGVGGNFRITYLLEIDRAVGSNIFMSSVYDATYQGVAYDTNTGVLTLLGTATQSLYKIRKLI